MIQLTYTSVARPTLMLGDIEAILDVSRRRNRQDGITGLLVFNAGCFMQLLEGEAIDVYPAFERIAADPRHSQVQLLDEQAVRQRRFGGWAMASRLVTPLSGMMRLDAMLGERIACVSSGEMVQGFREFAGMVG